MLSRRRPGSLRLLDKTDGLHTRKLRDLLRFHRFAAEPKINTHDPASPAAGHPCYSTDDLVQVFESYILFDANM